MRYASQNPGVQRLRYMGMGHAAGVGATLYLASSDPKASIQGINVSTLQRLLAAQGVHLHSNGSSPNPPRPPGPPSPPRYECALVRCVNSPGGSFPTANCTASCLPLGLQEWMGSSGAWRFEGSQAVALKDTHLKKSTADSALLPPSMVRSVTANTTCALNVSGTQTWNNLFFCSF